MGYSTDFTGHFKLNKKLHPKIAEFLSKFNYTRRMKRNVSPELYGKEGEFYVDGEGFAGQDNDSSVIDHNSPPKTQPGLWCQWRPTKDLKGIEWDGGEKFYDYVEWLKYLIDKVLEPNGYVLNGTVEYQGEEASDSGEIVVKNNTVKKVEN